ncbi:MAG TPA: alpha/beta fold hydrolase [Solirubrobacteraceae bacterium]
MRSDPTFVCGRLRLADGRRLNYSDTGPRKGLPIVYCHGAIGTPLGAAVDLEAIVAELGVRYVAISRPGIGGSDCAPGRTVLGFAADVRELVDALEIERFAVVGVSAGGPYALAVARELEARVIRVALCSSLSPLCAPHRTPGMQRRIRVALSVLAATPGLCAAIGDLAVPVIRRHPELLSRVIAAHAAPGERRLLQRAGERSAASTSFLDAASGGVRGMIEDYLVYSSPWQFSACEVAADIQLWHGLEDPLVPVEHALQLAIALPRCRVFLDPDEGHHFFRRRLANILAVLVGRVRDPGEEAATAIASARSRAGRRYQDPI